MIYFAKQVLFLNWSIDRSKENTNGENSVEFCFQRKRKKNILRIFFCRFWPRLPVLIRRQTMKRKRNFLRSVSYWSFSLISKKHLHALRFNRYRSLGFFIMWSSTSNHFISLHEWIRPSSIIVINFRTNMFCLIWLRSIVSSSSQCA